jgi:hypothetical protein
MHDIAVGVISQAASESRDSDGRRNKRRRLAGEFPAASSDVANSGGDAARRIPKFRANKIQEVSGQKPDDRRGRMLYA